MVKKVTKQIGVGCADIGKLEIDYVNDVLKRKRLSYGFYTEKFEQEFAKLHNRRFAIFLNSGTSALHLSVQALKEHYKWKDGDEVIVPALTFVASSNVLLHNNLRPVFVDVTSDHYDIDWQKIEEKITKRTRAIMPVNILGQSAQIDKILMIAKKHNLKVIEDSCETMLVKYQNKPVGSRSDISCFSTFTAHLIVTGVGGFATTNNKELAIKIRSLANHGRDGIYFRIDDDKTNVKKKLKQVVERRFNFVNFGHSFRSTELESAIGLAQLKRRRHIIGSHQSNAKYLTKHLSGLAKFIQVPQIREGSEHAFMTYPIIITDKSVDRDDLTFFLENKNIETRYLLPLLNQPIYKRIFGKNFENKFPVAKFLSQNGFYVGCHQELTKKELDYILDSLYEFFKVKRPKIK